MTNKMENKNDVTMEKNYSVYMHVCPNGKVYIGITGNEPNVRWQNGLGYRGNKYFSNAIKKYGWKNIIHMVIEDNLTKEQAENMEIELIAKFKSNDRRYGYNIQNGGNSIGKHSVESKQKMSEKMRNKFKNGCNPNAKKVYCDEIIFNSIKECANYYSISYDNVTSYLLGKCKMSLIFQQLNLRYATENDLNECEKYDSKKHGDKASITINIINKGSSKFIHCDEIIFNSIKECANYYSISYDNVTSYLLGKCKMSLIFQQLNLRYATENDLNECEKYDSKKHGDKASVVINVLKTSSKLVHCDGIIFNSIKECANYYSIKMATMSRWLRGKNKMPLDFQKLNLRFATNEDLDTYPRYTPVNN